MSVWCVVLAAGKGTRSGLTENKVFFRWQGRSVLSRCLDALAASNAYDGAVLVLSEEDLPRYQQIVQAKGENPLVRRITLGGKTRR